MLFLTNYSWNLNIYSDNQHYTLNVNLTDQTPLSNVFIE